MYSFYHEVPENIIVACPSTPEWKRPSDLDLNGEAKPDDDDDNGDVSPVHVCIFPFYLGKIIPSNCRLLPCTC